MVGLIGQFVEPELKTKIFSGGVIGQVIAVHSQQPTPDVIVIHKRLKRIIGITSRTAFFLTYIFGLYFAQRIIFNIYDLSFRFGYYNSFNIAAYRFLY